MSGQNSLVLYVMDRLQEVRYPGSLTSEEPPAHLPSKLKLQMLLWPGPKSKQALPLYKRQGDLGPKGDRRGSQARPIPRAEQAVRGTAWKAVLAAAMGLSYGTHRPLACACHSGPQTGA